MIGGRVLDSSAIVDAATGASVYVRALIRTAHEQGLTLAIPATALLDAWAETPASNRAFLDLLLDLPMVVVVDLTADEARQVGVAMATQQRTVRAAASSGEARPATRRRRHRHAAAVPAVNATLAQVAYVARTRDWPVVTAAPQPLVTLAPDVRLELLPSA